ncbi:hypothetical protein V8B97DRAFT_1956512 [Scleroderma yunnanense]
MHHFSNFPDLPTMCPSLSSMDMLILHGVGCILVFEYSYFLMQNNGQAKDAFNLAVKEYQKSGTQSAVLKALQHAIQEHGNNCATLQKVIIDIILENCMSKKFKF